MPPAAEPDSLKARGSQLTTYAAKHPHIRIPKEARDFLKQFPILPDKSPSPRGSRSRRRGQPNAYPPEWTVDPDKFRSDLSSFIRTARAKATGTPAVSTPTVPGAFPKENTVSFAEPIHTVIQTLPRPASAPPSTEAPRRFINKTISTTGASTAALANMSQQAPSSQGQQRCPSQQWAPATTAVAQPAQTTTACPRLAPSPPLMFQPTVTQPYEFPGYQAVPNPYYNPPSASAEEVAILRNQVAVLQKSVDRLGALQHSIEQLIARSGFQQEAPYQDLNQHTSVPGQRDNNSRRIPIANNHDDPDPDPDSSDSDDDLDGSETRSSPLLFPLLPR
ncbi:uncharacterized protein N7515_001272 [Penicillium bovifimosum]|uniref:Uncharacterized protein n=1 Tax=Penicillium bovifimosum TaxID=126998 RepID=A0A9W9L706_9EURO|nr:uncharacterized protein N7515_001272 [Penicillium bovifimosum]KAJ5142485.1 hypothetical protein N7515_001272 [Penicillium bovifimosum]